MKNPTETLLKPVHDSAARVTARFALRMAAVILLALVIFTAVMRPTLADIGLMAALLTLTSILSLLASYGLYRTGWINRSPRLRLLFLGGYALSSGLTFINVWITAQLMFASLHDLRLATILLLFAGGIAMIFGVFFAETLTERITRLNAAAQQIAQGQLGSRVPEEGRDELAQLAANFNAMADQLEKAEQKQHELDTLRRDLLAWVGHDLQTPLASIRAIVEALADGVVEDPATAQRYLTTAKKDIQSLSTLIDDLFQMAQLEAGGLQLDVTPGSISDLISDTLESFSELAKRREICLDGKVEPGIDPVTMDAQRIGRVLINLVDNALRFTNAGGSIHLQARSNGNEIRVEVLNTGSGIAAEDLPHVFERFYRGDKSRSRSSGGAGLGLAIAKGIVEAHRGQIGVASQPGDLTRFFFTLPQPTRPRSVRVP
jgi:signal transduction histidine kinase